jgi:hypothetical protein
VQELTRVAIQGGKINWLSIATGTAEAATRAALQGTVSQQRAAMGNSEPAAKSRATEPAAYFADLPSDVSPLIMRDASAGGLSVNEGVSPYALPPDRGGLSGSYTLSPQQESLANGGLSVTMLGVPKDVPPAQGIKIKASAVDAVKVNYDKLNAEKYSETIGEDGLRIGPTIERSDRNKAINQSSGANYVPMRSRSVFEQLKSGYGGEDRSVVIQETSAQRTGRYTRNVVDFGVNLLPGSSFPDVGSELGQGNYGTAAILLGTEILGPLGKELRGARAVEKAGAEATTLDLLSDAERAGGSSGGKYLNENWYSGTFPNKTQSVIYHTEKHGVGRTASEYTKDAMNFYEQNKQLGQKVILKDGSEGLKIQTKNIVNGKTQRVGGYWTQDGKLVTFWD